jgi:hypothetical protein
MRPKVPIAVVFEVLLHLLDCIARWRIRCAKDPSALRACPTLKARTFDPNEFSTHAQSISGPLKKGDNTQFLYRSYGVRRTY